MPSVFYDHDGFHGDIFATGVDCVVSGRCTDVVYDGQDLMFRISSFSSYQATDTSNLTVFDNTNDAGGLNQTHSTGESVGFYANYTNSSGGFLNGTNINCTFSENSSGLWSSPVYMYFNGSDNLYYRFTTFSANETVHYNITCDGSGAGYDRLSLVDDAWISGSQYVPASFPAISHWTQVSWFTAETVAHSISYGVYNSTVSCSQSAIYFVEPYPVEGDEEKINASSDSTGFYPCQNTSQGVMTVSNDGSIDLNILALFNQITAGITPKVAYSNDGWESSCSGICNVTECNLTAKCVVLNTSSQLIVYGLPKSDNRELWLWADFNNVAGTAAPTRGNLTTEAVST
jgi:hypothetical protein